MTTSCDLPTEPSRVSRDWSHDALHDPWWGHDLHHYAAPRRHPFSLGLPTDDPEDGCVVVCPQGCLSADALAAVMYAGSRRRVRRRTLGRAKRLVREIAQYDWASAGANRATDELTLLGRPALAQPAEKKARAIGTALETELAAVLTDMLAARVGRQLDSHELRVFLQLAARLAKRRRQTYVEGLQVCEWCDHVFPAAQRNARRCDGCRRKRPPKLRPVRDGGWHIGTYGDPAGNSLIYLTQCECGNAFSDHRANQRLCISCRGGADRVRRLRQRRDDPGSRPPAREPGGNEHEKDVGQAAGSPASTARGRVALDRDALVLERLAEGHRGGDPVAALDAGLRECEHDDHDDRHGCAAHDDRHGRAAHRTATNGHNHIDAFDNVQESNANSRTTAD